MKHTIFFILVFVFVGAACKTNKKETTDKAINKIDWRYNIYPSETDISSAPTIFLLHGHGSNKQDMGNFSQQLDPDYNIICPQGPSKLGNNKYRWYLLDKTKTGYSHNEDEVIKSSDELMIFVQQMIDEHHLDKDQIYIGGFSQGAILSLGTALRHREKIAGVLCLSGALYPIFKANIADKKGTEDVSVFISHGKKDKVLSYEAIEKDVDYLRAIGFEVELFTYDAGHTFNQECTEEIKRWLSTKVAL